jgi:acetolactate synthase-1/2/3 large subunit
MPKMTGHRYLAEAMRGYHVTHLFYVNSVVGQAMLEMDKVGVKRVVAHGEKAAAYMADG